MKFPSPVSVEWMADFLGAELIGDKNGHATGINEIHRVEKGDLVFVDHPKYYDTCIRSEASYIIINKAGGGTAGESAAGGKPAFRGIFEDRQAFPAF